MGDGMTFWQRSAAVLAAARDRVTSWAKDRFRDFVTRVRPDPNTGRDDPDRGLDR